MMLRRNYRWLKLNGGGNASRDLTQYSAAICHAWHRLSYDSYAIYHVNVYQQITLPWSAYQSPSTAADTHS